MQLVGIAHGSNLAYLVVNCGNRQNEERPAAGSQDHG
jgi:hypothetical protein